MQSLKINIYQNNNEGLYFMMEVLEPKPSTMKKTNNNKKQTITRSRPVFAKPKDILSSYVNKWISFKKKKKQKKKQKNILARLPQRRHFWLKVD